MLKGNSYTLIALAFLTTIPTVVGAQDKLTTSMPVAVVFGKSLSLEDLSPPARAQDQQRRKLDPQAYQRWLEEQRKTRLRGIVWSAAFDAYARERNVTPTEREIESHIRSHRAFLKKDSKEREQRRLALIKELKHPELDERRRKQAQASLDTLNKLKEHDGEQAKWRQDEKMREVSRRAERRVAEAWVKRWKVDQALYKEFGGRIIFQQAGWEPIDAYRKLLDNYAAKKAFVVHDEGLRKAVYRYFEHRFVYADEDKARFYFEKLYWERTDAELKAAGFKE